MKVLQLTSNLQVGGISNYVVSLSRGLKRAGVEVLCASGGGELDEELTAHGIVHFTIPLNTKNELHPKLLVALWFLAEIIREHNITHIHAHTRVAQVVASALARMLPVSYVSTCHGFFKRKILRRLFPAWGHAIIAISDPIREHLVNDFRIPKQKISIIPNGVDNFRYHERLNDFDKTELRKYYDLGNSNFIIGSVSKLEKTKGYQYLLQAIPAVLVRYPKTKFVLIGEGKYKNALRKLTRSLKIERSVLFAGKLRDVSFFLEAIDLFVLPAVWAEGFGLSILEAMACGKAVIATNIGSTYMLVKDGENGLLVAPKKPSVLSEAIIHVMENPDLLEQMGKKSLQIAQKEFSLEPVVEKIRALYESLQPAKTPADEIGALLEQNSEPKAE